MSTASYNTNLSPSLIKSLDELFNRSDSDPRPVVLMTCGLAGAGKSTLSKLIAETWPNFKRLSIDLWIHSHYGLYAVKYPKTQYAEYQVEARKALKVELATLLKEKQYDVILDFAFPIREVRAEWQRLVEAEGGRWILAYLEQDEVELRRRVKERNALTVKDADSAFDLTDEILNKYLAEFEVPAGEDEINLGWVDGHTITKV